MTKASTTIMYASRVSREMMPISLTAILNNLDMKVANILNTYIQAPIIEKGFDHIGS